MQNGDEVDVGKWTDNAMLKDVLAESLQRVKILEEEERGNMDE